MSPARGWRKRWREKGSNLVSNSRLDRSKQIMASRMAGLEMTGMMRIMACKMLGVEKKKYPESSEILKSYDI